MPRRTTSNFLTPKRVATLRFIADFSARGYAPTLDEIAAHFGIVKVSAFERLLTLESHGYIRRGPRHKSRQLTLTDIARSALGVTHCPTCGRANAEART